MVRRRVDPEQDLAYGWEEDLDAGGEEPVDEITLTLRRAQKPRLTIRRGGVLIPKTCSIVQLLGLLDSSTTVSVLSEEESKRVSVPPLPERALLLDVEQYARDNEYVLTGWLPPAEYPFVLERSVADGGREPRAFLIPLPTIVYRARWSEKERSILELSIALCPAFPEDGSVRDRLAAPLYRYPFSNIYGSYGSVLEGVCWPTMRRITLDLDEVPEKGVRAFLATPNNADLYGVGRSQNSPHERYADFLAAVEKEGLHEDWLIPARMTAEQLHRQKTPKGAA